MNVNELIYMVMDEVKLISDDSTYTEEHILFLLSKYRSMLLKKLHQTKRGAMSASNTQTICADLEETSLFNDDCEGNYIRSKIKIPNLLFEESTKVYPTDFKLNANFVLIPRERCPFIGHNKYLKNIIYCYIGPDHYLYFNSSNPQISYLKNILITGVFEDFNTALELSCDRKDNCDKMLQRFPIEESLVPELIQAVVKELLGAAYRPKDSINSASDDLADLVGFARKNMKNSFQKQIEE